MNTINEVFISGAYTLLEFVDPVTGEIAEVNPFVKIFIIMGALLFAKQLPQLIEELLGIKLSGKFSMNPLKKMSEVPLAGAGAHTLAGGIDSMAHGNGFWSGVRRNYKDIPLLGGDGKTSILETSDRKMRRDVHQKRDYAKQRYESAEATRKLEEQRELGKTYSDLINDAGKDAEVRALSSGKTEEEAKVIAANAKALAERKLYGEEYYTSKKNVDDAKVNMYAWDNAVTKANEIYANAVTTFGAESTQAQQAYAQFETVKQKAGQAKGQYEYRNAEHKNLKGRMPEIAKIEDAIEAYEKMGGKNIGEASNYVFNDPTVHGNSTQTQSGATTAQASTNYTTSQTYHPDDDGGD